MNAAALLESKNALRVSMRRRLADFSLTERTERSARIVRHIVGLPAWRAASRVALFAPLPSEPDVGLLWSNGALDEKRCAYPRVQGDAMQLYYTNHPDELEPTRWGLREPLPQTAREATLDDFDLVLVPGLAFDAAGGRLGRGGGFYDRLLSARNPARTRLVGLGFSFQLLEQRLPLAAHDVRLDAVCTDADGTAGPFTA